MKTKEFTMEELEQKIIEENKKLEELEQSIKQCKENLKNHIKLREVKNKRMRIIDEVNLAYYERIINENGSFILEKGIIPMIAYPSFDHYEKKYTYIDNSHEIGMEHLENETIEEVIPVYKNYWDKNKDDIIYPYARRKMTDEEKETRIHNILRAKQSLRLTRDELLDEKIINTYIGKFVPLSEVLSDMSRENASEKVPNYTFTYDDLETVSDYINKNANKYGINMNFEQEKQESNRISAITNKQIISPSTENSGSFKR